MVGDNLGIFFGLYTRPRRALARCIDEGSLGFGAVAVVAVSLLWAATDAASALMMFRHTAPRVPRPALARASPPPSPAAGPGEVAESPDAMPPPAVDMTQIYVSRLMSAGTVFTVVGLAVLFVPVALLITTLAAPVGSFGVAFRRDYGSLATCVFFSWAAVHLPLALARVVLTVTPIAPASTLWSTMGLSVLGAIGFGSLTLVALRIIFPVSVGGALVAVLVALFALLFQGFLIIFTSPFALYLAYLYFGGNLRDIQWSLSTRRSLRRQLEVATINPRDADAHYQLGLLYLARRQYVEARARFEKAIEILPGEIEARYQLGRLARREKKFGEAIEQFQAVIAKDPKHAQHEVWREIGGTYLDAGDFAHALPPLERFARSRSYDPEGLCLLGQTLIGLGEREKAREALSQCIEAARTTPDYRQHEVRAWRRKAARLLAGTR